MYECVREIVCVFGGESHIHSVNTDINAASCIYFLIDYSHNFLINRLVVGL